MPETTDNPKDERSGSTDCSKSHDQFKVSMPFGTFYRCEKCNEVTNTNENHVCGKSK